jgi:hypothetical protein
MMIHILLALSLQATTPSAADKAAILAPIDAALAALGTQDSAALLTHVYPEGRVVAVGTLATGAKVFRRESWADYAARMKPGNGFIERISDPKIEIDGDIALVWAPFTIERGGKITACGYDHFDMVRHDGAWKIMNITFSSRPTGCPGQ